MESNHRPAKRQKFKEQSHASAKALFVVPARDKAFADPRILSNLRRWLFVIDVKRLDLVSWDELQCTNSRLSRLQLPPLPDELIGIDEEDDDNPSWTNTMVESLDFNFDRDILTATVFTHTNGFVDPDLRVLFSRLRSLKRFAILSLGEFVTNETWEYICRTSLTYLEELCIAPHDFPRAKTRLLLRYTPHLQRVHYLTLPSEFDGEYCQNMQLWFMDFAKHLVILSLANRDVSDCELADFAQHSTLPQHLQYLNLHECKEVSGWGLNAVLENFSKLRGLNALSTGRGGIMAFTETHGELSYDFVGTKPINEPLKTWACASTLRYLCLGFDHSDDDDDGQRPEWLERYDEDSPLHELTWDDIRQVRRRFDSLTALRALTLNCTCVELDVLNDWTEEDKKSVIYVNNSDGEEKDEKMEEVVPSAPPLLDRLDLLTASFFRSSLTGNNTHPDYGPQSSRPGWWFKRVDYLQIGGRHGTRKAYVWRDDQEQVPSDRGLAVYVSDATTAVTLDPGVDGQWEYRKWEVLEELSSPSLSWLRQGLEPIGFNFR
ncbi:hypothetical protein BGZ73_007543 [Actinomortierella ambigua]|nr:hypothetical protein BGZ73_007543 [Actinomortierella ambigua]